MSDKMREVLEKLVEYAKTKSDNAYCDYIAQMKRMECVGYKAKLESGKFGDVELLAHVRGGELFGRHRAMHEIWRGLAALLAAQPDSPAPAEPLHKYPECENGYQVVGCPVCEAIRTRENKKEQP